jgi:N-acetylmuramoyl-L-alanine amidase
MTSKYLYLLDPGHGGLDEDNNYVTPGKRSPLFEDGSCLYEGVNNREIVKLLQNALEDANIDSVNIVDSYRDISLNERVRRANELGRGLKCIYISIHSDAFGNGKQWTSPSGISVYTSVGQTKSDEFADYVIQELQCNFENTVKWRFDKSSDGDKDKEAHFYVLRKTLMPAILCELGFHTNKEEAKAMLTKKWKLKVVKSIVDAIKIWELKK